jgi:hypothetical protein
MPGRLTVAIPDKNAFYSLYSDGLFLRKTYARESASTLIEYDENAVCVLYYTYPTHREACVIRNAASSEPASLPGLSKKTSLIFSVQASKVDKLRRAVGFLHKKFGNAFNFDDGFYIRLSFLLRMRGKLNYPALRELAGQARSQAAK